MTHYNENDGLYYEDENFTILANGWFNDDYAYYIDGNYTGLDSNGNGFDYYYYFAYFIGGVMTTLNGDGFGTWNDVFYALGSPNSNYTGPDYWDYVYYIESQPTSLDINGNGEWNGNTYVNGVVSLNGWVDGVYYINNVATTLDSTGSGTWNGKPYINGVRQYLGEGLKNGLMAFYKLDDLTDSSGNNYTLTNSGDVTFTSGKIGNAAVFNEANYLELSENLLAGKSEASISTWVKTTDNDGYVVACGELQGIVVVNEGGVFTFNASQGYSPIQTSQQVNDGQWHHLVVTFSNGSVVLYIDGQQSGSGETDSVIPNSGKTKTTIGQQPDNNWASYIGEIDATGIWNRVLTESEISALYNDGNGLEDLNSPAPSGAVSVKIQGNTKFFGKVKFA